MFGEVFWTKAALKTTVTGVTDKKVMPTDGSRWYQVHDAGYKAFIIQDS